MYVGVCVYIFFRIVIKVPLFGQSIASQIYPHGSTDTLPYATMGSGSLAAMAIFESKYREGMNVSLFLSARILCCIWLVDVLWILNVEGNLLQRDEGIKLVAEAILSGVFNDLGSGSNVDICVITKVSFPLSEPNGEKKALFLAIMTNFQCRMHNTIFCFL